MDRFVQDISPNHATPKTFAPIQESWLNSPAGREMMKYPCLAEFTAWMQHIWLNADLTPTGDVPDHRHGKDKYSGIEIKFDAVFLPVIDHNAFTSEDNMSTSSLLMEGVGVVELLFFPPEPMRASLKTHLRSGIVLPVAIPTMAWFERKYTKLDIFEALCKELAAACQRVEAMDDHLVYAMLPHLRCHLLYSFIRNIGSLELRTAPVLAEDGQTRLIHCSFEDPYRGIVFRQIDSYGCQLGFAIWTPGDYSYQPSYTTLFYLPATDSYTTIDRILHHVNTFLLHLS